MRPEPAIPSGLFILLNYENARCHGLLARRAGENALTFFASARGSKRRGICGFFREKRDAADPQGSERLPDPHLAAAIYPQKIEEKDGAALSPPPADHRSNAGLGIPPAAEDHDGREAECQQRPSGRLGNSADCCPSVRTEHVGGRQRVSGSCISGLQIDI